ncbi:exported hypothetical protein [Candidatus Sulfopaludibacter sp. SbA4]|nr:exported hypothetical protein [Candidatus Sulfopaludibacter sp. SbA4]
MANLIFTPACPEAPATTSAHPGKAARPSSGSLLVPIFLLSLLLALSPPARAQFTQQGGATPVNAGGSNLSLTLNIAFTAAFAANRVIYVAARDVNESNNTDWHAMATWTPQ